MRHAYNSKTFPDSAGGTKKKREAIEISVKLRLEFTKLFTDPGIHKIMELIKNKNIQESQLKKPA